MSVSSSQQVETNKNTRNEYFSQPSDFTDLDRTKIKPKPMANQAGGLITSTTTAII